MTPAPADTYTESSPAIEYVTPAPALTHAAPARVIECVAPALVIELNCVSPSQQFPPYFMSADTADVGRDVAGLANQDRSTTAVKVSAPQCGLRPLLDIRIQKQNVKVRRVRLEEQSVGLPDPPTVEDIVDITPQERLSTVHCGPGC